VFDRLEVPYLLTAAETTETCAMSEALGYIYKTRKRCFKVFNLILLLRVKNRAFSEHGLILYRVSSHGRDVQKVKMGMDKILVQILITKLMDWIGNTIWISKSNI